MSEDESFEILGTSPTDSMENYSIIQKLENKNKTETIPEDSEEERQNEERSKNLLSSELSKSSLQKLSISSKTSKLEFDEMNADAEKEINADSPKILSLNDNSLGSSKGSTKGSLTGMSMTQFGSNKITSLTDSKHGSLAVDFLLGETDLDVLKASVFSQFPSLSESADAEDLIKLQNFMIEYVDMKSSIQKSNSSMRQQFTILQKWQNEIKAYKDQQEQQIKECLGHIAKLRNENLELRRDLNTQTEQIQINEKIMKKENEDLIKLISEKSSIIQNMSLQIEKLEQNQHTSFEYVKRTDDESDPDHGHEYIRVTDHKKILEGLERKLSEVTAEKIELEDMKKRYIDEINCLKVNLTAAEELLKKNQADISILKSKDLEKTEHFEKYEKEKEEMKQEITLLRNQLDLYSKDFQMEREARQNLAADKEHLLTDLKMLQRRNQQLLEEASARLEKDTKREAPSTSVPRKRFSSSKRDPTSNAPKALNQPEEQVYTRNIFVCPLCDKRFPILTALENHVQSCLDNA